MTCPATTSSTLAGGTVKSSVRGKPGTRIYRVFPQGHPCDKGITFHSSYEYNYAQYLEASRKDRGIAHWVKNTTRFYFKEPVTYTLPSGEERSVASHVPDFLVFYTNSGYAVIEIQGWVNAKAEAVRAAFLEQFPGLCYRVVDKQHLLTLQDICASRLPDWIPIKGKCGDAS
jgi:hypothetical protein